MTTLAGMGLTIEQIVDYINEGLDIVLSGSKVRVRNENTILVTGKVDGEDFEIELSPEEIT